MPADPEWLKDLFEPFGAVRLKRMFGGYGVYAGDFMVAMAIEPGIIMRVDPETQPLFEAIGAKPFVYQARGRDVTVTKWWRMPDELLDDPDELARWARLSLATARSLPLKKPRMSGKVPKANAEKRE